MNRVPDAYLQGVPVYVDSWVKPMDCHYIKPDATYWQAMIVTGKRAIYQLVEDAEGLIAYDRDVLIQRDYD